jgi:hypothetical protein
MQIDNTIKEEYVSLYKDLDGYYVRNTLTGKRSASVEDRNNISEQMIKAVLMQ